MIILPLSAILANIYIDYWYVRTDIQFADTKISAKQTWDKFKSFCDQ